ncbi:MAG: hypothetical protein M3O22_01055 [Pseudomonadota bacterium]|nr:hypothetical protein [Pseudomonadota bacterium]
MLKILISLILATLIPVQGLADNSGHAGHNSAPPDAPARLEVILKTLDPEQANPLFAQLAGGDGSLLTPERLEEVHTEKVHFLVVDETLADYHHLHPEPGPLLGTYITSFTPSADRSYRIWADITPVGQQRQFPSALLKGQNPCSGSCADKTVSLQGQAEGLKATLSFDGPLKAGIPVMGTFRITTDASNQPITDLEPVMGARAHIAGFYDDFATMAHIHPLEQGASSPGLQFHLTPERSGFLKLFLQVRQNGRDILIPFGVTVS